MNVNVEFIQWQKKQKIHSELMNVAAQEDYTKHNIEAPALFMY